MNPDNSNPRLLEIGANWNQNRFTLDLHHTINAIFPLKIRTLDNSNLSQARNNFCFPSINSLYNFTLIDWNRDVVRFKNCKVRSTSTLILHFSYFFASFYVTLWFLSNLVFHFNRLLYNSIWFQMYASWIEKQ